MPRALFRTVAGRHEILVYDDDGAEIALVELTPQQVANLCTQTASALRDWIQEPTARVRRRRAPLALPGPG